MTIGLPGMLLFGVRWDDALAEGEAAVETALAGLDDAIGLLGPLVESVAFDADHRPGFALGSVHRLLHFLLHRRDLIGFADDLHARRGIVDERVERIDREHG